MKKILVLQNPEYLDSQVRNPVNYDNILDDLKKQGGVTRETNCLQRQ